MKNKRRFLIKESLKRKIFSRWFIGINILLFLLIFVTFHINSIISFFGGDFKDQKTILIKDELGIYSSLEKDILRVADVSITAFKVVEVFDQIDLLKEKVKNDKNMILLVIEEDSKNFFKSFLYSKNGLTLVNENIITASLKNIRRDYLLKDFGLTMDDFDKMNEDVEVEKIVMDEKTVNSNKNISASITVLLFLIPSFFLITILVQMIGAEINEEKMTKSMEIIISNVTPLTHLTSKIISCIIFTFLQIGLILLFVFISSLFQKGGIGGLTSTTTEGFVQSIFGNLITKDFLKIVSRVLPILIPSFLLTIVTYALLAGIFASMTTNIDDFQQLQTPLMFIISIGFYLSLLAFLFNGSTFIKVMSYFPLISFMLSPSLYILGQISIYSVLISFLIEIVFFVVCSYYGIRIYRVGLLNYSGDHLWKKIIKSLKKKNET
ncbi:MAG: ABC transporter permease [Bacilli bacterium]|nr:ABC transporter permease [Bacilli bacterium]